MNQEGGWFRIEAGFFIIIIITITTVAEFKVEEITECNSNLHSYYVNRSKLNM